MNNIIEKKEKFNCPGCGVEVILKEAESFLNCASCKTSIYLDLTKIVLTLYHKPLIPEKTLGKIVSDYLRRKGVKGEVTFNSIELEFYPFWKNDDFTSAVNYPAYLSLVAGLKGEPVSFTEKNNWKFIYPETFSQEKQTLIYHPFYTAKGVLKGRAFVIFIDGVDGEVIFENLLNLFPKSSGSKFSFFIIGLLLLYIVQGLLIDSNPLTIAAYALTSYILFPYFKNLIYEE